MEDPHPLDQQMKEMKEQLAEYQSLVKHPGWVRVAEVWERWIQDREHIRDKEMTSMEDALKHNTALGELRGLLSAVRLPEQLITGIEDQLEAMKIAKRSQEENEYE